MIRRKRSVDARAFRRYAARLAEGLRSYGVSPKEARGRAWALIHRLYGQTKARPVRPS